jgi:hypothetical protein
MHCMPGAGWMSPKTGKQPSRFHCQAAKQKAWLPVKFFNGMRPIPSILEIGRVSNPILIKIWYIKNVKRSGAPLTRAFGI